MKTKKVMTILFIQNIVTIVIFGVYLFYNNPKQLNENTLFFMGLLYLIPSMISVFLLGSGILVQQSTTTVTFGETKSSSLYERLGKLFFAETMITGIAKKDFIDNQKNRISKVLGIPVSDVYELYGELNALHGEYLKKESEDSKNKGPVGFKSNK